MDLPEFISRAKALERIAETDMAPLRLQDHWIGQSVTVRLDVNGGEQPVAVMTHCANTVFIKCYSQSKGAVLEYFPKSGYRIDGSVAVRWADLIND